MEPWQAKLMVFFQVQMLIFQVTSERVFQICLQLPRGSLSPCSMWIKGHEKVVLHSASKVISLTVSLTLRQWALSFHSLFFKDNMAYVPQLSKLSRHQGNMLVKCQVSKVKRMRETEVLNPSSLFSKVCSARPIMPRLTLMKPYQFRFCYHKPLCEHQYLLMVWFQNNRHSNSSVDVAIAHQGILSNLLSPSNAEQSRDVETYLSIAQ